MTTNPEETFYVGICQNLYREVALKTNDYKLRGDRIDYDNTNWDNVMIKNRHYTPLDLLHMFVKYLENSNGPQHLIDECNSYLVEDTIYEVS